MCIKPLRLEDRVVNCRKCIECRQQRSAEWAFRLQEELKDARSAVFVTLTYDDLNLPVLDTGFSTLRKLDVQIFIKALRDRFKHKRNEKWFNKIRYYFVGEYGAKTARAHYHGIIFNIDGKLDDIANIVKQTWNKGFTVTKSVNLAAIRYVTDYMNLKDDKVKEGQEKPFALMSKKPIIGNGYLVRNSRTHYNYEFDQLMAPTKAKIPLYEIYFRKSFTDDQKLVLKTKRKLYVESQRELKKEAFKKMGELDPFGFEKEAREKRHEVKNVRLENKKEKRIL